MSVGEQKYLVGCLKVYTYVGTPMEMHRVNKGNSGPMPIIKLLKLVRVNEAKSGPEVNIGPKKYN